MIKNEIITIKTTNKNIGYYKTIYKIYNYPKR
jgi:hypothetical protein